MNCIDAVEGTVKTILVRLQCLAAEYRLDDTEHIRNIRTIVEATEDFVRQREEIFSSPEVLRDVLYDFAKGLWLEHAGDLSSADSGTIPELKQEEKSDYLDYYYDTLYHKGIYPR